MHGEREWRHCGGVILEGSIIVLPCTALHIYIYLYLDLYLDREDLLIRRRRFRTRDMRPWDCVPRAVRSDV
jgi:hypothetical protein